MRYTLDECLGHERLRLECTRVATRLQGNSERTIDDRGNTLCQRGRLPKPSLSERVVGEEAHWAEEPEPAEGLELGRPPAKSRPHLARRLARGVSQRPVLRACENAAAGTARQPLDERRIVTSWPP